MKIIKLFTAIIILQSTICYGAMTIGFITRMTITGNRMDQDLLHYAIQGQLYTNGGLTFTYPVGLFPQAPIVTVSLQPNGVVPMDTTYVAEITTNSATSTMITVKEIATISPGVVSISEAATNDATIYLQAFEDPLP
jgi:hypothetical protein